MIAMESAAPPHTDPTNEPDFVNVPESENASGAADEGGTEERIRSKIAFPYVSLNDAEAVAGVLQQDCGGTASHDQLAGALGSTTKSGSFRMKVAAARTFGLMEATRGNLKLSALGRRLVDPDTQAAARVEAFLHVPLFRKAFEEYQGGMLPSDKGLEKSMADWGVSVKQTAKARQALHRSADHAGFFRMGRNRLVKPPIIVANSERKRENDREDPPAMTATTNGTLAEPVQAAWLKLLREGRSWSPEKTHEYVEATRKLQEVLEG
jgi:hypothetical protein